jgi:hypothetical protein
MHISRLQEGVMKRLLVFLASLAILLPITPTLAAVPSYPPSSLPPAATVALPPAESVIGFGLEAADAIDLPSTTSNDGERAPSTPYEYPRLALGTNWVADWLDRPGGMAFLYQFQEIYGPSTCEEVLMVQRRAREQGHAAWANKVVWVQGDCLVTTSDLETDPPEWAIGLARNNVGSAINMAVYMNRQLGVDWFLRDINGQKMPIWSPQLCAVNLTPDCPLGAWDGIITYRGRQYSLGDTRGLTLVQWLRGPFSREVIRRSLFAQVFDGLEAEDYPFGWLYYFNGQIPDPKRDGVGFPVEADFEAYCRDVWRSWFLDFLKPLQDKFVVTINNHNTRWYFDRFENPWPEIQQAANGCKLEQYFGGGTWPRGDIPTWSRVYHAVEDLYHPLSISPDDRRADRNQGWDVSIVQLNAPGDWPADQIDRFKRAGLASALMGDGLFDGTATDGDCYYTLYLRHGQDQYAPHDIREMHVKLGRALGASRQYTDDPLHPLEYRQFRNAQTGMVYTVVSNVWDVPVADIPAQDGVWFRGLWPTGPFARLNLVPSEGGRDSVRVGHGQVEITGTHGGSEREVRAVPSVTRTSSRLEFSAPVPAALEVSVVSVSGRIVRRLALAAGQKSLVWDGCDAEGGRVGPGVYFVRAGVEAGAQTARVLIVR